MISPKENFLRLMRNDHPMWLGDPWSCFNSPGYGPLTFDAVTLANGIAGPGETGKIDIWGITWDNPAGQPGAIPNVTDTNKALKDIHDWKTAINFDNLPSELPWDISRQMLSAADPDKLVMVPSFMGMFEFSHYIMGYEDALCNYMTEPDEMYALLSAYADWKIQAARMVIDELHPDIIHSHDDWGSKERMFLPPAVWREIIKPQYERYYGYIKSRGVLVQHHCDGVANEVCEDMVDLGIDMWQGVLPQNDIKDVIERTGGKICIMGGLDMQKIDFPEAKEEDIRAHIRDVINTYMPLGSFIPCVTSVVPIFKHVGDIISEELNTYGEIYAKRNFIK